MIPQNLSKIKLVQQSMMTGSGGISISNCTSCCDFFGRNYNVFFNFDFPIIHNFADPEINFDFDFNHVVSSGKLYWYRVMLYCQSDIIDSVSFCPAVDDVMKQEESISLFPVDDSRTFCSRARMRIRPISIGGVADVVFSQNTTGSFENGDIEFEYKREDTPCQVLQGYLVNIKCAKKTPVLVTAVVASDLDDLCNKLRNPLLGPKIDNFRICSVTKFATPVNESSGDGVKTELEPQDVLNITSCVDYNLDFNLTKFTTKNLCNNRFVFYSFAKRVFYFESDIYLITQGQAKVEYVPSVSGEFLTFFTHPSPINYTYYKFPDDENFYLEQDSSDVLLFQGSCEILINPLIRTPSSGYIIELTSDLGRLVFPFRKHEFSLSLNLSSNFIFRKTIKYNFCNYFKLTNSEIDFYITNNYKYNSILNLNSAGFSKPVSSNYNFVATGGASISLDRADVVSAYRKYTSRGGLSWGGSPRTLGRCFLSQGGSLRLLSLYDEGLLFFLRLNLIKITYKFNCVGEIKLSGLVSGVISGSRQIRLNDNNIYLDGESEVNFSNLGLFLSEAIFYSTFSNATVDILQDNSNLLSIDAQEVVSSCGCEAGSSIYLDHNLSEGGVILDFLNRNKSIDFDSRIYLNYKSNKKAWVTTKILNGFSQADSRASSKWSFIFELSCTNLIENEIFDENYLKFNFFVKREELDGSSITNLIAYLSPEQVCNGSLSAVISRPYNNDNQEYSLFVNSEFVPDSFYRIVDNIGIFSSDYWNRKFNYDRLRPSYYPNNSVFTSPKIVGEWPEFRINFGESFENSNIRKIKIENPATVNV